MNPCLVVLMFVMALVLGGCRSSQETESSGGKERIGMQKPNPPGPGIPPGHCRIIGTVVAVDSALSEVEGDPCAEAPCVATVRIVEVVGFGSGFTGTVGNGSEIKVRFRYTLAETSRLFPEMSPVLPGLQKGSTFVADVALAGTLMAESEQFVIEKYELR